MAKLSPSRETKVWKVCSRNEIDRNTCRRQTRGARPAAGPLGSAAGKPGPVVTDSACNQGTNTRATGPEFVIAGCVRPWSAIALAGPRFEPKREREERCERRRGQPGGGERRNCAIVILGHRFANAAVDLILIH